MIPLMKHAFVNEYETKQALADFILKSTRLSMSEECARFEKEFSQFQKSGHAVLFNSGGSANLAMLQTLKNLEILPEGANIGFSALTWATNVMPIIQLGFNAIPIDVAPETLNVMSNNLKDTLKATKLDAFLITNALGFAGDLQEIKNLCDSRGIILLEDNCEALGTVVNGRLTGSFGKMATSSFFVAHHMSTIEGGMVCTDDDDLAAMLKIVRANGWDRNLRAKQQKKYRDAYKVSNEFDAKYTFYDLGYNFRPTEITGFLGCYQMRFLSDTIKQRQANYLEFEEIIHSNPRLVTLDHSHIETLSCFATPILCATPEDRTYYIAQFSGAGIEIRPMISGNIQEQPFFKKHVRLQRSLPGAEFIHNCGFYCGNYIDLTNSDKETIKSCLES